MDVESAIDISAVIRAYGPEDMGSRPLFSGDYINFGYWANVPVPKYDLVTRQHHIEASRELYRLVFSRMSSDSSSSILEIGIGHGAGFSEALLRLPYGRLVGIDICAEQIQRAKALIGEALGDEASLRVGVAADTGCESSSLDFIYGVECAQCFPSILETGQEAQRILRTGGKLVLAAHWSTGWNGYTKVLEGSPGLDPTVDRHIPIQTVLEELTAAGLNLVECSSIGAQVFPMWDRWLRQEYPDDPFQGSQYRLFNDGHLDYHLLVFEKRTVL